MSTVFNACMTIPTGDFPAVDGTLKLPDGDMKCALFAILAVTPNTILRCIGPGIDTYDESQKANERIPHKLLFVPLLLNIDY